MIGAIILGLLAGYIAKALLPGDDPGGFFVTILLGIYRAVAGRGDRPSRTATTP